jgi:3-isopropylmalate/(R)-2-methylmalate dehydratase small subunit
VSGAYWSNTCRLEDRAILKKVELLFVVAAAPQPQTTRSAFSGIALNIACACCGTVGFKERLFMVVQGYVLRVDSDINPERIIASEYAASGDPAELAAHCLEQVNPHIADTAREGDLLVVAGNVLDGSGSDAAVHALQALGIAAWICYDAAPAFVKRSMQAGLPLIRVGVMTLPRDGVLLRLDLARGIAEDQSLCWTFDPLNPADLDSVRRFQLWSQTRRMVDDEGLGE